MFNVKITVDHDEIKKWVEKHQGKPVILDDPDARGDKLGLRIDFPGKKDEEFLAEDKLGRLASWNDFFQIFEEQELAFIYQKKGYEKDPTLEYEFIKRENIGQKPL